MNGNAHGKHSHPDQADTRHHAARLPNRKRFETIESTSGSAQGTNGVPVRSREKLIDKAVCDVLTSAPLDNVIPAPSFEGSVSRTADSLGLLNRKRRQSCEGLLKQSQRLVQQPLFGGVAMLKSA